jgi:hypothetical protein
MVLTVCSVVVYMYMYHKANPFERQANRAARHGRALVKILHCFFIDKIETSRRPGPPYLAVVQLRKGENEDY